MDIPYRDLVPLVAIACGSIVGIIAIVATHIRISQRDEMSATLKMEMIQRGMSAEEIERVLRAPMTAVIAHSAPTASSAAHRVN